MSVSKTKAVKLLETAKKLGWDVNASHTGILRITKHFTAGSMEEFVECDMESRIVGIKNVEQRIFSVHLLQILGWEKHIWIMINRSHNSLFTFP